jgi:DNA-binding transcriptional regulator YhcF (GntR family)
LAKKNFLDRAVEELTAFIGKTEADELPSLEEMSGTCGIGVNTMLKALRILEKKGLVDCRQGRRARIRRTSSPADEKPSSDLLRGSADTLFQILRREITDGKQKIGNVLPKTVYLAAKMRMSHRNIVKVLRELQKEKLIHKSGKKWVVGPPQPQTNIPFQPEINLGKNARAVIILSRKLNDFKSIEKNDKLSSFFLELIDELEKCSTRIILCGTDPSENGGISPAGLYNVECLVRSLGDKYAGSIIAPHLYPEPVDGTARQWISLLHTGKKPVVWCDVQDLGPNHLSRETAADGSGFYSILQNRSDAVTLAVKTLWDSGHSSICCPFYADVKGMSNSSREIKNTCLSVTSESFPGAKVFPLEIGGMELDQSLSMWDKRHAYATPRELLNYIRKRNLTGTDKPDNASHDPMPSRAELAAGMPQMAELIFDKGVTAVLGPNDFFICQLFGWLSLLHVRVPEDVSLISFDNSSLIRLYPLASIDWGLRSGAYLAVRLILNDIPVSTNRNGVVYLKSTLFNRGSIGQAKRKPDGMS